MNDIKDLLIGKCLKFSEKFKEMFKVFKVWHIYIIAYYTTHKRNELDLYA